MNRDKFRSRLIWLPLAFVLTWSALPLLWSLSSSFKERADFAKIPPPFFPASPTLAGYEKIFADPRFGHFFWNSTIIAIVTTVLAVILSTLTAYGFARYAFKFRHLLLLLVLIPRLVPRVSLIVPGD